MILTRAETTNLNIQTAAFKLFTKQGYAATSMRQIASAAGISLGSIYNHFNSKEEIFLDIIRTRHPFLTLLPAIRDVEEDDLVTFIGSAVKKVIELYNEHPEFINLYMIEITEFKGEHAKVLVNQLAPEFQKFAVKLRSFHNITDQISDLMLVRLFISVVFGFILSELLLKNVTLNEITEHSMDALVSILVDGIQKHTENS